jgi:adenylate cyclase
MATDAELVRLIETEILGEMRYSGAEVAARAGIVFETAERLWVEVGFPPIDRDEPAFSEADIEALLSLKTLQEVRDVSTESVLGMARVLGQALSRVAASQIEVTLERFLISDGVRVPEVGTPEGKELRIGIELSMAVSEGFITYVWRRHLAAALRRQLDPRKTEVVGFVDLVGYTRLTTQLDEEELPALLTRFQHIATSNVATYGGQVVKLIGDAVMFNAPDAPSAARAALGIRHALREEETVPRVRIGLAVGPVVRVEGDVYGDTVNRASRLAELARPDAILVDDAMGAELFDEGEFTVRQLRPRRLRGIGLVRSWSLREPRRRGGEDEMEAE